MSSVCHADVVNKQGKAEEQAKQDQYIKELVRDYRVEQLFVHFNRCASPQGQLRRSPPEQGYKLGAQAGNAAHNSLSDASRRCRSGSGQMNFAELAQLLFQLRRDIPLQEARAQAVNTMLLCDTHSKR